MVPVVLSATMAFSDDMDGAAAGAPASVFMGRKDLASAVSVRDKTVINVSSIMSAAEKILFIGNSNLPPEHEPKANSSCGGKRSLAAA